MIRFNIVYQKGLSYMQIYHYNVNMFCSKIKFHKNTVYIALSVLGRSVSIFFFSKLPWISKDIVCLSIKIYLWPRKYYYYIKQINKYNVLEQQFFHTRTKSSLCSDKYCSWAVTVYWLTVFAFNLAQRSLGVVIVTYSMCINRRLID